MNIGVHTLECPDRQFVWQQADSIRGKEDERANPAWHSPPGSPNDWQTQRSMRLLNRFVVDHLTNDLPQHERGPLVAILWVTVRTGDQRLLPMAPLQARMHMSALVEVLGQVRQFSCSHSDRKRVRMDGNLDEGCPFFIAYPFRGRKVFSKPIPISSLPAVARVREVAASPVVPGRPAPRSPRPGRGSASFAPSGSSSGWDIARR